MELRRTIYPETKPSHTNRAPLKKERSEKMGEGAAKSFAAIASGPRRNTGGGSIKEKEIVSENILDFEQQSKPNPNLNKLTLNMENWLYGRNKGDGGSLHLSLNIHLICGPNGDWRVQHTSIGDSTATNVSSKPKGPSHLAGSQTNLGFGSSGASTSYVKPKPSPITRPQMVWKPRQAHPKAPCNIEPTVISSGTDHTLTTTLEPSNKVETQVSVSPAIAMCLAFEILSDGVHRT